VRRTDLAFLEDVDTPCEVCDATGFRAEALEPRLDGRTVLEVLNTPMSALARYVPHPDVVRLAALLGELGLGHLASGRTLDTLSGGERQRLKLARQLDATSDDLLVDEPTAGLHPSDTTRMVALLDRLVDEGRTLVVVEHSLHVVAAADWVVDLGPGAGENGGRVLYAGTPKGLAEQEGATGRYFRAALDGAAE